MCNLQVKSGSTSLSLPPPLGSCRRWLLSPGHGPHHNLITLIINTSWNLVLLLISSQSSVLKSNKKWQNYFYRQNFRVDSGSGLELFRNPDHHLLRLGLVSRLCWAVDYWLGLVVAYSTPKVRLGQAGGHNLSITDTEHQHQHFQWRHLSL